MEIEMERWRDNWRAVGREGAVRVDVSRSAGKRQALEQRIRGLDPGTPILLCASAPRARRRCRVFASVAGIEIEREYLAFPTAAAPAYLVEDAPAPVGVFVKAVLVAPPRSRFSIPIDMGLYLLRAVKSWRLTRTLAPGRVIVGKRASPRPRP